MAGLGRKTWSPGDTLTAADVNGYLMDQSVMVFAGTAARSSAIPSPSAGMVAYSTATQLQVYNGSAWTAVSSSGLVYLTGASFSGATTVSFPTDTFTATYQNYKIVYVISSTHVAGTILSCRLRAAGADSSASSYYGSMLGAQGGTTQYLSNNPTTSYQLGYLSATAGRVAGSIDLIAPKEAVSTRFISNCIGVQAGDTLSAATVGGAFFDAATVFDSLTLISGAGNLAGNYRVYGYSNA